MKKFRLSTAGERVAGVFTAVCSIAVFALLLYALRGDMMLLIFTGLCVTAVSALLIGYAVNVIKAAAYVDAEKKQLHVKCMREYTVDLSEAAMMQTFLKKNVQSSTRLLVFSNKDEEIIATVNTMFTFRQGMWAEPMAKEMAAELGIDFKQTIPEWQFDKELYKQHVKEEAERERVEAKERRKKKMEMRIQKIKNRK